MPHRKSSSQNRKRVDDILASTRALYLEAEIASGKSVTELTEADPGHRFILPLLEKQTIFQNNPRAGEYWYPAVDGFPVPSDGIIMRTIPDDVDEVILATDGYPVLLNTLEQSERALQDIIAQDPLLFRKYRSTKGVVRSNVSFDDRAYLRITLTRNRSLVSKRT